MFKILIAEDEPDIRELIAFTLQFGGYNVTVATNGAEAVEKAPDLQPDLIMLDVRMPRMTGYEACKALKDNPKTAHIPVIFLSAKGQEAEVQTGMEAGALDYILKPFAPDVLLERVKEVTENKGKLPEKKDDGKDAGEAKPDAKDGEEKKADEEKKTG